jgi:hypothetical protein
MNNQVIKKLNDYYIICKTNNYKHNLAAEEFDKLYNYTTTPIILVTALTTVFSAYNTINSQQYWVSVCVTILSGITSVSHSLATFFEFNKKYTSHYTTANSYMALTRLLENECLNNYSKIIGNDAEYIQKLFNKIINELNNIQKNEQVLSAALLNMDCDSITYGTGKIGDDLLIDINPKSRRSDNTSRQFKSPSSNRGRSNNLVSPIPVYTGFDTESLSGNLI